MRLESFRRKTFLNHPKQTWTLNWVSILNSPIMTLNLVHGNTPIIYVSCTSVSNPIQYLGQKTYSTQGGLQTLGGSSMGLDGGEGGGKFTLALCMKGISWKVVGSNLRISCWSTTNYYQVTSHNSFPTNGALVGWWVHRIPNEQKIGSKKGDFSIWTGLEHHWGREGGRERGRDGWMDVAVLGDNLVYMLGWFFTLDFHTKDRQLMFLHVRVLWDKLLTKVVVVFFLCLEKDTREMKMRTYVVVVVVVVVGAKFSAADYCSYS